MPCPQDMLASWSGPFAAGIGDRPGVRVVELSLVESVVRPDTEVANLVSCCAARLQAACAPMVALTARVTAISARNTLQGELRVDFKTILRTLYTA